MIAERRYVSFNGCAAGKQSSSECHFFLNAVSRYLHASAIVVKSESVWCKERCMLSPGKGIPDWEIDGSGIARSPTNQRLRPEGIAWKCLCNCVSGMDPRGFTAALSDPPFKYKKAAPSLLQTTSSQPPFHFSKHPYPLNLIVKMASAESDLVRCYDNGRALHTNISLKRT